MKTGHPTSEDRQSLWLMIAAPSVWALHFLLCYITAAIWCEKMAGPDGRLGPARTAIWVYTIAALAVIGLIGWSGYRRHSYGSATLPHDEDTPEDRHRFLGFSTLLLSGLSLIGVVFEAMVLVFFWNCH